MSYKYADNDKRTRLFIIDPPKDQIIHTLRFIIDMDLLRSSRFEVTHVVWAYIDCAVNKLMRNFQQDLYEILQEVFDISQKNRYKSVWTLTFSKNSEHDVWMKSYVCIAPRQNIQVQKYFLELDQVQANMSRVYKIPL